jgi:hypothetical protein
MEVGMGGGDVEVPDQDGQSNSDALGTGKAWKAGRDQACRNASMNVNVCDVRKREK